MATVDYPFGLCDLQTPSGPCTLDPDDRNDLCDFLTGDAMCIPEQPPHDTLPNKIRRTRNRALCGADWERAKPMIVFLYYTNNMILDQVMVEMRENHGFDAGRSAYNDHITQWGINKNFKASEKQAVIDLAGSPLSNPDLIMAPFIPPHRLARHVKDCRRRKRHALKSRPRRSPKLNAAQTICHEAPQSFQDTVDLIQNVNHHYVDSVVTKGSFLFSPSDRRSEFIFKHWQEYIQIHFRAFASQNPVSTLDKVTGTSYEDPRAHDYLISHLNMVYHAYRAYGRASACQWLDKACELVKDVLQRAHWRLLDIFGSILVIYNQVAELGKRLARSLAEMAEAVYGNSQHCIVQLFQFFTEIDQPTSIF